MEKGIPSARVLNRVEAAANQHAYHGAHMPCPTCGAPGRLDLNNENPVMAFPGESIWYVPGPNGGHWECADCYLK